MTDHSLQRDRDQSGRARNARPRDGLGRPLPYGDTGVARLEEGVIRPAGETIALAQRLLDDGAPFQAHEVFEDAWKASRDRYRSLWKGLAQMAVGVTHSARGNLAGAVALLRRAAITIEPFEHEQPHGLAIATLRSWCLDTANQLESHRLEPTTLTVPSLSSDAQR